MLSLSKLYTIILIGFGYSSFSQNLISNPSFEQTENPVDWNSGAFNNATVFPHTRNVTNWDWYNTPDYFSANVPYTGIYRGVPINQIGTSYAKHGIAYGGFISYYKTGETKEYVFQQLGTPLLAGEIYCVSFFVSRADRTTHAIHSIAALFTATVPPMTNVYISGTPQIVNQNGFITDTVNWTEIQGCFTAQGGEQYITIGNFNSNANTDTLYVGSTDPLSNAPGYAYYYIDSLSLYKDNLPTGIFEVDNISLKIYPNPTRSILNFELKEIKENTTVEMTNSIGELVLTNNLTSLSSSISISHLRCGIYFYYLKQNGVIMKRDKFIIN